MSITDFALIILKIPLKKRNVSLQFLATYKKIYSSQDPVFMIEYFYKEESEFM